MKVCKDCRTEKPLSEFNGNPNGKRGRNTYCRTCGAARMRAWRARQDPEVLARKERDKHLQRTYGISLEDYERMLEEQGGVCALCDRRAEEAHPRDRRPLVVDHCHLTGRVRGLLCGPCNSALYPIDSFPGWIDRVQQYL